MSIKNQYGKNLNPEDLEILDSKIALCNEKIAAKQNALNDEKAIKETEYRIKNLVNEISNELRENNQKNKASIESEYLQEYLKISGVQGDYAKTRDIQTEFSKDYDQGISFVISYLDNQLQLAGIDKGIVIGSSQNKTSKSLNELNTIESEINSEKEQLLAILSAYKSIYENDFKIFITYNEYDKMKSSISGVETYKLIKEPIFDSYKMLFKSDIERLNQTESNTDRLEKAQAIVKLSDKVIDLANSDSKSIEKELKKTSDKEAIRQIISS